MITNRQGLRDKIHEIHNYMRNNGVGYGLNALKVFNLFYGLMKIGDKLKREDLQFNKLFEFASKGNSKIIATI